MVVNLLLVVWKNPSQTPHCLILLVQAGGGLVLPAFPALLLSCKERGKRRMKMEGKEGA